MRAAARPCRSALGCTAAHGLDDARAVALSPDGKSLYVASATPATVTTFTADSRNGLLQQLNLSAGCLTSIAQADCGAARALEGASAVAVSPDGLHVYVAAAAAGAVASFARQPNGSLVQLVGIAGCVTTTLTPGCANAPALAGAERSRSRRTVASPTSVRPTRTPSRCSRATPRPVASTPLPGAAGCLRANRTGCTPVTGVDSPSAIALSPDGASLYVTSTAGTLTSFQRDVAAGTLTQLPPGSGCLSDGAYPDCTPIGGLARASAVVVSPDGATVVAAGTDSDAVSRSGATRRPARSRASHCVTGNPATPGCVLSTLLLGPRALAIRPDSRIVWVASSRDDAIVTLQLDPATSALTPTAGHGRLPAPPGLARLPGRAGARRSPRSRRQPRRPPPLRGQRAQRRHRSPRPAARAELPRHPRATVAYKARSVVLACSDPNGDKVALTIVKQPPPGRLGPLAKATGGVVYTPFPGYTGPTRSPTARPTAWTSADGTAPCAYAAGQGAEVRIRTARTHLLTGEDPRPRGMPGDRDRALRDRHAPDRQGQGRRVWLRATGAPHDRPNRAPRRRREGPHEGPGRGDRRDKTRRATISRRTIVILP